ncbi:Transcriptional regulator, contains XRE-family HTH domain [Pseudomonas cuatrocienegasensis]|uniref:Transcriptional regulator, contains XRE-family HTH domain n=1 Tax=Pseudomonas cuatrocienegasensis TaxID=543360 RepID=A0ABY1B910_9PSED|nr:MULTISPECIES: helix-turn-helix transcriptional regulator [Pseudomonas]OEC35688.1 transcriptional regulator [Pseudomonas sp. 21C1]SEQ24695.1 Transcriptional regulator, contains XRE-family HTH domain [Pseudomonas cuatrocienegasensis]
MGIGDRLKEERQRLGLNQSDFAALAGVAKNSQLNYEKGERSPDAAYLAAVAASGVDVLYIVTGKRTPEPSDSLSAAEADLLERYRELPEVDRAHINRVARALAEFVRRGLQH